MARTGRHTYEKSTWLSAEYARGCPASIAPDYRLPSMPPALHPPKINRVHCVHAPLCGARLCPRAAYLVPILPILPTTFLPSLPRLCLPACCLCSLPLASTHRPRPRLRVMPIRKSLWMLVRLPLGLRMRMHAYRLPTCALHTGLGLCQAASPSSSSFAIVIIIACVPRSCSSESLGSTLIARRSCTRPPAPSPVREARIRAAG